MLQFKRDTSAEILSPLTRTEDDSDCSAVLR